MEPSENEQRREQQCYNDYSCSHILTCPTCSKKYDDLDKMVRLYREINRELQQERDQARAVAVQLGR
jgi:hypothetical protein